MEQGAEIRIIRPDDWHLHLRDGAMLRTALPYAAEIFGRAMIMPNLRPPVRSVQEAAAYRQRIMDCLPPGHAFLPLMTLYLTETTPPEAIRQARQTGWCAAVKLYPLGATTHSEQGVSRVKQVYPVLDVLQELDLPLSVHGEVSDPAVDIFDREAVFVDRVLDPLRRDFPELRIVLEHVTTRVGVEYVQSSPAGLAASITPHHLLITRNELLAGGFNPHLYCLPVAKREADRQALLRAAVSGDPRFFFGSDSAPHWITDKEKSSGAAGIFNSPTALPTVVQLFERAGALDALEAFCSLNGARFYGLPPNQDSLILGKTAEPVRLPDSIGEGENRVKVFQAGGPLFWRVVQGLRPGREVLDQPVPAL